MSPFKTPSNSHDFENLTGLPHPQSLSIQIIPRKHYEAHDELFNIKAQ